MESFRSHTGLVAPLDRANVDTDQIIPKQFLKRIERTGYGEFLFFDWRSDAGFILNRPEYSKASILLAGRNFGCGSSREHAPWALQQYGFRVIIAPCFADIFGNNALKNGLLAVSLQEPEVTTLFERAGRAALELTVNLESCRVSGKDFDAPFTIDSFARHCLLHGLDDIGLTLQHESEIAQFEAGRPLWMPTVHGD
ncbi:MAG: 3-isopropylmalate dehydratase small subunit [Acidobacteria bacterium]|nr:3-isopropylmalate dehydratase small subunit [Acidobacteriota bacterium]